MSVTRHLLIAAVVALAIVAAVAPALLPDATGPSGAARPRGPAQVRTTRPLLLLGLIAFAGLFAEGAAADWSAVYLAEQLSASPGLAGAGFIAFSLAMTIGRLSGDRLVQRTGPVPLIRVAAGSGAVSLAVALLIGHPVAAIIGFGVLGAGLACLVPVVFTAAAHGTRASSTAVATVSTLGYLGFVIGPPLIGALAHVTGLTAALGLVAALTAAVALLADATAPAAASGPSGPDGDAGFCGARPKSGSSLTAQSGPGSREPQPEPGPGRSRGNPRAGTPSQCPAVCQSRPEPTDTSSGTDSG